MNWLDWAVVVVFALAAFKGFQRGFIIELSSLLALLLGIWTGVRVSKQVGQAIGLGEDSKALAFLITFIAVLILVHVLARALTKLIDSAQLGVPNKLAGIGFGVIRSAFTLSVMLNLLAGWSEGSMPSKRVREDSRLYDPIRAFAPFVIPALGETKWIMNSLRQIKQEAEELIDR